MSGPPMRETCKGILPYPHDTNIRHCGGCPDLHGGERRTEHCEWNTKLDAYTYRYCRRPSGHEGEHDFSGGGGSMALHLTALRAEVAQWREKWNATLDREARRNAEILQLQAANHELREVLLTLSTADPKHLAENPVMTAGMARMALKLAAHRLEPRKFNGE